MTIQQVAEAFIAGKSAKCHNAKTDGRSYWLHGNRIAQIENDKGGVELFWCGWYTPTTASHMNAILKVSGAGYRVSYAKARDEGVTCDGYRFN